MRPFTLLQRSPALRQIPAAGSTFLAYIFKAASEFQLTRSASHSRPRLAFYSPVWARSLRVARCQLPVLKLSACRRTSAPLQDLSILPDLSALPGFSRINLPSRVARSAFAPRRVAIVVTYHRATDQRSSSATSRLARCPSNLLEP